MTAMNRYALHALVGLNLLLALLLAALWIGPDGKPRNLRWQPPQAQVTDYAAMLPDIPAAAPLSTGVLMVLLERPLFSITRRPPPPPPPPKAAEAPPPDTLSTARLLGLYAGQGEGGVILHVGGKNRRVRMREHVEGWTLTSIDQRSATFTSGGTQRTLPLLKGSLANFTGQAPTAMPPPAPTLAPVPPSVDVQAPTPAPATVPAAAPSGGAIPRPQPIFGGSIR